MEELLSEFVPMSTALRMRRLKFNEPCIAMILGKKSLEVHILSVRMTNSQLKENAVVPTIRETLKWLREKHGMLIKPMKWKDEYYYEIEHMNDLDKDSMDTKSYTLELLHIAEMEAIEMMLDYIEDEQTR